MPLVRPSLVSVDHLSADDALAVIAFGAPVPQAMLTVDAPQLGEKELVEVWRAAGDATRGESAGIVYAHTDDVLFGAISCDDDDAKRAGECVYARLLEFARSAGYPHLLRVWNHLAHVNAEQDGLERYRAFCAGRYEAFVAHGYRMRGELPAASAVGMNSGGLATYFIAAREPGAGVENPRQVSAFEYPSRYGPRSPSFSRAMIAGGLVFVSGTASVVGHETKHPGDIGAQLDETLTNIDVTLRAANGGRLLVAKAYIRREDDYPLVAQRLREALPDTDVLYLRADICRADLLVEIDGVALLET